MDAIDRYKIEVFFSQEDDCYIANVPDVKYCSAHGDTPEQALAEVRIALAATLKALKKRGHPLPRPSAPAAV